MITYRVALLISFFMIPAVVIAQGFDCNKAQKPVERLICQAPEIGMLDKELNTAVQARLSALPQQHSDLLMDSKQWLKTRDKLCDVSSGALSTQQREAAINCLRKVYQERLDFIGTSQSQQRSKPNHRKAVCTRFVDAYQKIINAKTNDPKDTHSPLSQKPLDLLANTPKSGVTRTQAAEELSEINATKLDQWGLKQTPPIHFSVQVKDKITELGSLEALTIDHGPNTNFFIASVIGGTASCVHSVYFTVVNGVTTLARKPLWSNKYSASCGVERFFGTIDGQTVAVEYYRSWYESDLSRELTFKTWNNDHFDTGCSIVLNYDPTYMADTDELPLTEDEQCESSTCKALEPAIVGLAEAVQRGPLSTLNSATARLSTVQREAFNRMVKLSSETSGRKKLTPKELLNPAELRQFDPLLLPVIHEGELYLASIGHYAIGWRTYPDWRVKIEKLEKGELKSIGVIIVAMRFKSLHSADVK